jgi:hypothetical protein
VAAKPVTVFGLDKTKRLLREHAPELKREMDKTIRVDILGPVVTQARNNVPSVPILSGWNRTPRNPGSKPSYSPYGRRWDGDRLRWDATRMRSQITVRQGGRAVRGQLERSAWSVVSNNPAAAVFELMGRGRSDSPMVGNVMRRSPRTGRVLYKAWDETGTARTAPAEIVSTIRRYERMLQARLDSGGDR